MKANVFSTMRNSFARCISRMRLPPSFSIISDDCWGGQLYRVLKIPYQTPTVGLWIEPSHYLDFIDWILSDQIPELNWISGERSYPVADLNGVILHFQHYHSETEATETFSRRFARLDRQNLLFKIDFAKPGYSVTDILRWNRLRFPKAIALYNRDTPVPPEGIYQGLHLPEWTIDGASQYDISRRYFDMFTWIRSGRIRAGHLLQWENALLFDPFFPQTIRRRISSGKGE